MNILKNQTVTRISHKGHGIINKEDEPELHVLGVFPGDVINTRTYKKADKIHYGEVVSFEKYSTLREYHPLKEPFFDANTPWEHLSIDSENTLKNSLLKTLYSDHLQTSPENIISFSKNLSALSYRNKVAYSFMISPETNDLCFALYSRGVSGIEKTPQVNNLLVNPVLEKVGKQFLNFFNQKKMSLHKFKYLVLRYSYHTDSVVAHLLVPENSRKKLPFKKSELESFLRHNPKIQGVLVSHSEANLRSAITTKDFYSLGNIILCEKILDKTYSYHPSLFFQIYPKAFEMILNDLRSYILKIPQHKSVPALDLFAGVGVIGIEITDIVKSVTGVELSTLSKEFALKNAEQNNVSNFSFVESDVSVALELIENDQILLVDPTRAGLSKDVLSEITKKQPTYICYISCNPESQYRDFKHLKEFYTIELLRGYNIFPKTHHIESMLILKRKKND